MRSDESGFTLVELLIAFVIVGIIIGPLTGALLLGLQTATRAQAQTTHSSDESIVTSYFDSDTQSSSSVTTGNYCSGTGATAVLGWTDPGGSRDVHQSAYVVTGSVLERLVCLNGAERRRIPIGRNVASATVSCRYTTSPSFTVCNAPSPLQVRLTVNEDSREVQGEQYSFSLTSTRRVEQ